MEKDWNPSLSLWDRGIEAVETAWDRFISSMSFNGQDRLKNDQQVINAIDTGDLEPVEHPETREDRYSEIVRLYSEATRGNDIKRSTSNIIGKPMDLESQRQDRIYYSKQGAVDEGLRTTPVPSPQGELFSKGQSVSAVRQQISQADRDAARNAVSTKTPAVSPDHVAQRRIETRSKSLEL